MTTDVVICGAGIAGIATAHALAVTHCVRNVLLVDERAPLTLTSDKSTEAYRNWWPGPDDAMVRLIDRSIDLLEQWSDASDDRFGLNRRGYLYATRDPATADRFAADAARASAQGAGPIRVYRSMADAAPYRRSPHRGFRGVPDGADLFLDSHAIRQHFPWMHPDIVAVLHARRCGWFSGQQLGMYLLEEAKAAGVQLLSGRVERVVHASGAVEAVDVAHADGTRTQIRTPVFVNAAGPYAAPVGALVGAELPLFSEAHYKIAIEDTAGVIDRDTGLVILDDAQLLAWGDDEREELAADDATRWLTEPMPAGIHLRPEGYGASRTVLMLWDYHSAHRFSVPEYPMPDDALYPELVLRGMTSLAPGLAAYLERLPHAYVDGGYYTKTAENRPLVGPSGAHGAFVCAAFSGFGLMAAPACGELLAAQIIGATRPPYERAFLPTRYDDPAYVALLANWGSTGQL
ncbi:NAD(P)/FAD-dependent oxidoreductase [Gemmatimonas groenlandica]|uniref:FAD-binding oxidoreductase n=1 Tax=Gemmatimonas groenlandica TaxID=2732249 RepID=A0A6M4IXH3_9BACT|nr:FAD-binding oxidoreductase [Gemmatimonas groenlandica]QJR38316.1 FAD-binding oxidoreductase [Gemmatimonas groenlandica]